MPVLRIWTRLPSAKTETPFCSRVLLCVLGSFGSRTRIDSFVWKERTAAIIVPKLSSRYLQTSMLTYNMIALRKTVDSAVQYQTKFCDPLIDPLFLALSRLHVLLVYSYIRTLGLARPVMTQVRVDPASSYPGSPVCSVGSSDREAQNSAQSMSLTIHVTASTNAERL